MGATMKSGEPAVDMTLDATGLLCPEPVFRARRCLAEMEAGQVLEVLADDPLAEIDFTVFCEQTGHEMLVCDQHEEGLKFLVRKARV